MASTLTWLDYSERDRRRALDVIDLFRESGTVDEMGIGQIRDGFSDLLFPGTSTIQTRACYFLLLPWTFLRLEGNRVPSSKIAQRARQEELGLNDRLAEGTDADGVMGKQAGRSLKRLPSAVYWGGLKNWGIRLFPGPIDAYFRSLDGFYRRLDRYRGLKDDPDAKRGAPANWHPHVPDPPKGFPYEVSVALRRKDAEYLRDRIQAQHPGTLLAELASRAEPSDLEVDSFYRLDEVIDLPPRVREQMHQARLFSLVMHGAALLYNLMLAEALGGEQGRLWSDGFSERLSAWTDEVAELETEISDWDLRELWQQVEGVGRGIPFPTKGFVQAWLAVVRRRGGQGVIKDDRAQRLIGEREWRLKRSRARLRSRRHLELWRGSSGTERLKYRWPDTQVILKDIFDGLTREDRDAGDA